MLARTLFVVAISFLTPITASSQELASHTLFDGKVTMLIPVGFEPMSEEMLAAKYPRGEAPKLGFTNPDGSVNVATRHTPMQVGPQDVALVHRFVEQTFQRQFPTAVWFGSTTGDRNGIPYFTLDFMTPAVDTSIRNIMLGTSLEGRMLLVSFNCTRELDDQWALVGRRIIDSITLVDG